MKKYIICTILAIATLVSCQQYEELDIPQSTQTLTVSLPNNDATTRVTLTDGESSVTLDWESDDKFTIYTTAGERVVDFLYSNRSDDGSINFASTDANTLLSDNAKYIAIYPSIDGVTTLEAHRAELESRLLEQTQTGNSDNSHLKSALRLETEFTYSATSDTQITFEHQMATMRLSFTTDDGAIPTKIIFSDGDFMSYTINFDKATQASSYTAHFVIMPNEEGIKRELGLTMECDNYTGIFSVESAAAYTAGVQYRSELSTSDLIIYDGLLIYTKADLIAFRDGVNAGNGAVDAYLMADIDLSGEEWEPIGVYVYQDYTTAFTGKFEGNEHTISNLTIDNYSSDYQGLFGYTYGSEILNLTMKNPNIKGNSYVGAICGYLDEGSVVLNCNVDGGSIHGVEYYVGGLIGLSRYAIVSMCSNTSSVSSDDDAGYYTGGIIGRFGSNYGSTITSYLTECNNSGSVSGHTYVGGIAGQYAGEYGSPILNCHNTADITGSSAGGIIGTLTSATITDCDNSGKVSASGNTGGIIGYGKYVTITNCFNTAEVIGGVTGGIIGYLTSANQAYTQYYRDIISCYNYGKVTGNDDTGGIAGYANYFNFIDCHNTAEVFCNYSDDVSSVYVGGIAGHCSGSITSCSNTNNVTGSCYYVGGVVGYADDIIGSYNSGDVVGSGTYVGGVCSKAFRIIGCYNEGDVKSTGEYTGGVIAYHTVSATGTGITIASYNSGDVSGVNNVGGIVGCCNGYGEVVSCYNIGDITGESNVGELIGDNSSHRDTPTECYYTDSDTSIQDLNDAVSSMNSMIESYDSGNDDVDISYYFVAGTSSYYTDPPTLSSK